MAIVKLLIPLLLLTVQGVAQQEGMPLESMAKDTTTRELLMPEPVPDHVYIYTKKGWIEIDRDAFGTLKLEIQTLRSLNDSLTRRLKEQIEYRAYASEIIKELHAKVNKLGAVKIRIRSEWGLSSALFRYQRRYPELIKQ